MHRMLFADGVDARVVDAIGELRREPLAIQILGEPVAVHAIAEARGILPVLRPFDGEPLYPGRIYVARHGYQMRVERGCVRVSRDDVDHHKPSIDELFRTTAEAYGPAAIGVVLTGYLEDGAEGLKAIKDHGGITIVQDPTEAGVPHMPLAALAKTPVDYQQARRARSPAPHAGDLVTTDRSARSLLQIGP